MNKTAMSAAAIILLGGVAAWTMYRAANDDTGAESTMGDNSPLVAVETPAAVTEPVADDTGDDGAGTMAPAKRIRHGTASGQELANTVFDLPSSGNEEVDKLIRRAEKALAGDIDALIDLARLIDGCQRGMSSEEQLQQRLDRMAQFQSRNPGGPAMPGRGGGSVEFESFEELEADMWARFDECQVSKEVLDESLYEQVSRLAEAGVPSARYLYAVWPPNQDSFLDVDVLELLEYQSLALDYTWLNMQERNPLGLLAMSQSYGARRPSMFTPGNGIQSQVFLLASMKCGVDNKWLERRSLNFEQSVSRFQGQGTEMPSLDDEAAALAEMFCPPVTED
jgi:hypothetical protein